MTRKIIICLTASVLALSATACNTVQGVGRDIEAGGEAIQRAVK